MISRRLFAGGGLIVTTLTLTGCGKNATDASGASDGVKRVALISFGLETNFMAPSVGEEDFRKFALLNREAFTAALSLTEDSPMRQGFLAGALDAGGEGWALEPIFAAWGGARGPITDDFLAQVCDEIRTTLKAVAPLDGVYVSDHGGAGGVSDPDPDGAILQAVRDGVGPATPVVANHDLHGHISERMVKACQFNIAHRENPHIDGYERGVLAGDLLNKLMAGEIRPVTAFVRVPVVCPQVTQLTAPGTPYGDILAFGDTLRTPSVLDISVLSGYSLTDTDKQGLAILVATDNDPAAAKDIALKIGEYAWAQRRRFVPNLTPIDEAIEIMVSGERPMIFADVGDNPGGGANGNNLTTLKAVWAAGLSNIVMGTFYDPATVEAAFAAGEGAEVALTLTGENDTHACTAKVLAVSEDGVYKAESGIEAGGEGRVGKSCALDIDGVHVIVNNVHEQIYDEGAFGVYGLNAEEYRAIILKARGHFRAAFDFVAVDDIYELDSPGLTPQNLTRVAWRRLPRPIFPLDDDMEWTPELALLHEPDAS